MLDSIRIVKLQCWNIKTFVLLFSNTWLTDIIFVWLNWYFNLAWEIFWVKFSENIIQDTHSTRIIEETFWSWYQLGKLLLAYFFKTITKNSKTIECIFFLCGSKNLKKYAFTALGKFYSFIWFLALFFQMIYLIVYKWTHSCELSNSSI